MFYWMKYSFLVNCFRNFFFRFNNFFYVFLILFTIILGFSVYLISWVDDSVFFFFGVKFLEILDRWGYVSDFYGRGELIIGIEVGIWVVCKNKERKLIFLNILILL